jgi:Protein of unknown function (DUF2384)
MTSPAQRILATKAADAADIAAVTETSQRAVQRWIAGQAPHSRKEDRLLEMASVAELAVREMPAEVARQWLHSPVEELGWRKPLDVLRAGRYRDVIEAISAVGARHVLITGDDDSARADELLRYLGRRAGEGAEVWLAAPDPAGGTYQRWPGVTRVETGTVAMTLLTDDASAELRRRYESAGEDGAQRRFTPLIIAIDRWHQFCADSETPGGAKAAVGTAWRNLRRILLVGRGVEVWLAISTRRGSAFTGVAAGTTADHIFLD